MEPRIFSIDNEKCKGCRLCIGFCPVKAIDMSSGFNSKGSHYATINEKCTRCGICITVCPDWAIITD